MYLYILFIIIICLLILSLLVTNFDFVAPINVFLSTYFLSCLFAVYNAGTWSFDMHANTFAILLIGIVIFLGISLLFYPKKNRRISRNRNRIEISTNKLLFICLFDMIILVAIYLTIYQVASSGVAIYNFSKVFYNFRIFSVRNPMYGLPGIIVYSSKVCEVSCYIFIFAYFNNISIDKNNIKRDSKYLFPVFFEFLRSLESGARLGSMNVIIAIIAAAFIYLYKEKSINHKVLLLIKYIFLFCGILVLFFYSAMWLGRTVNISMIDYISIYTGAPLKLLDMFLQRTQSTTALWGEETFYYVNRLLGKWNFIDLPINYSVHLEYGYIKGKNIGNVYTAYRKWFNDFGMTGVILLQSGFALFYNIIYKKLIETDIKDGKLMVFYLFFFYALVMHFFDDKLYRNIFCTAFIVYIILIRVLYAYLVENKIKIAIKQ